MSKPVLFAYDGNWLLHRVYHTTWGDKKAKDFGFRLANAMLGKFCKDALAVKATHAALVFDGSSVFRYDIYENYKSGRLGPTNPVYDNLNEVIRRCRDNGLQVIQFKKFEADDVLCALAHTYSPTHEVVIGTVDKDSFQYLKPGVRLYDSSYKVDGSYRPRYITHKDVPLKIKVTAEQSLDYQTLIGDGTDGFKGPFTPAYSYKGLIKYGSIQEWAKQDKEFRTKLKANWKGVQLCRQLAELRHDCLPPNFELRPFRYFPQNDWLSADYHAYGSSLRTKGLKVRK